MISLSVADNSLPAADGLRPINLRTDLAALADLIELVFADSMDSSGRVAVREMRYLSRMGVGLSVLAGMNELAQGISLGYVWIADGKLVGNVSVYSANWHSSLGSAWIIANVGVHPDYQRRGIARRLMQASMDAILAKGGQYAVLQVDAENEAARHLYRTLGFVDERTWTTWRREGTTRIPAPYEDDAPVDIVSGRDWEAEYNLAQLLRPFERGGLGWMRPLHPNLFKRSWWQRIGDWLNLRSWERLVIHDSDRRRLLASLWIENSVITTTTQLTLMVEPELQGAYDEALLNLAVRRFGGRYNPLTIEHPEDEVVTNAVLRRYSFRPQRTVVHMRWDVE